LPCVLDESQRGRESETLLGTNEFDDLLNALSAEGVLQKGHLKDLEAENVGFWP
jgi:hypothetical protein